MRPGAGRKKGETEDFSAVNKLPERPNLTLIPVLRIPFAIWAQAQGLPELELEKDEGVELALPVTQLLEFYFPGKIPEIAWVWLLLFSSISNVMEPRLKILSQKRKEKKAQGETTVPTGRGSGDSPSSQAPPALNNNPATGFPKNG